MDLQVEMPPVTAADLSLTPPVEGTAEAARRVAEARTRQLERSDEDGGAALNARLEGGALERLAPLDGPAAALLEQAAVAQRLSARGWTRTRRLARTIADLDGSAAIRRIHVAEALIYRKPQIEDRPTPNFRSVFAGDGAVYDARPGKLDAASP